MLPYIGELIGTFLLVLLGDSVVANVTLNKSGMKGAGALHICLGWGFAVLIPAFIFGASSGAHLNPAVTIALAVDGSFSWAMVPGYILAQMIGGFLGAVVMYIMFKDMFDATEDPDVKFGCFATSPSIKNYPRNIFSEVVCTFVLIFGIKGMGQIDLAPGLGPVMVYAILCSIGMSFGGVTGYAINLARDWGPRIAHTVLPIKGKGSSHWDYAPVTLVGPMVGAVLAALLYKVLFG